MKRRFVQINGELVEVTRDYAPDPKASYVMGDIQPYKSMLTGETISSRSKHREHLREHGCIEVGNDSSLNRLQKPPIQSPPGLKEMIAGHVYSKLRY